MLDLFSGIGGFSLAASWTGSIETVAFCEIEPFCQKVLKKHWPDVPIYQDITELRGEDIVREHGPVDIVCGGFPCQPFSYAGKRRGKADDRHLWPEMFRIIQETKPTWVVGENVVGLIDLALEDCFLDLESEGYEVQSFIIPACGVGAPHRRNRVWILANSRNNARGNSERRSFGRNGKGEVEKTEWPTEATEATRSSQASGFMANTDSEGLQRRNGEIVRECPSKLPVRESGLSDAANTKHIRPTRPEFTPRHREELFKDRGIAEQKYYKSRSKTNWDIEPDVGRVANGIPHRIHRLKALGNSIVPQVVYPILQGIVDIEEAIT